MDAIYRIKVAKMFPKPIYEKGKTFVERDQVSDLLFDVNNKLWTANVHAEKMYFVEINVSKIDQGSLIAYCDCPAFATYDHCEHIVAVLLAVQDRPTPNGSLPFERTEEFIQQIMMKDLIDVDLFSEKTPLTVEYFLSWDYEKNIILELRVGEERTLFVRNVFSFLQNVLNHREHYFTKTFTYDPENHYIPRRDMKILGLLYSMMLAEKRHFDEEGLDYEQMRSSKRKVILPYFFTKDFLSLLVERNLFVETFHRTYDKVTLAKDDLPLKFSLLKQGEDILEVTLRGIKDGYYFPLYNLLFIDGVFYTPEEEQKLLIEQIDSIGLTNFHLPISKEQRTAFFSEVLPHFNRVGIVEVEETLQEQVVQVPLQAELYLAIKNDLLIGDLRYRYGKYVINPFEERDIEDVVLIRDGEKEQLIMTVIERADFRYNGEDLYIELGEEEQLFDFLYSYLPLFEQHVKLYITDEVRNFMLEERMTPETNVKVDTSSNLLEIGFDISGIDEEEIPNILQAVIEKKRYYRMDNGTFLSLEEEQFYEVSRLLDNLNITEDKVESGVITLPAYRAAEVDELISGRKNYGPAFQQLLAHLRSPEKQLYPLPEGLKATLRNYQKTGYQWFKSLSKYKLGGILADDMGLGKTLQTIAYLLSEKGAEPHLVVVPSSVLYNWKSEFQKFAPSLKVVIIHGTPEERLAILESAKEADVWISSYATLRQDIKHYKDFSFHSLILDEAQYIKNYATKTSQAVRQINATYRFALSGTPIENSLDELWAIFQVVLPGLMPNLRRFRQLEYEKIASLTKPFILRRVKEDVLTELPEKIESVHISELTLEQKELYLAYLHELQQETSSHIQSGNFHAHRMKILAGLTRLRQICCHPSMFVENYTGGSGKLTQLLETIETSMTSGKRMLVFSQFTSMHEIIIEELKTRGIDYFYLHGQTNSEERLKMSERFNNGEKDVFLISLRAGGTGLNLTGADTVILYDLWWNPAVEDQATGRAHRFGQKKVVQVIRLITEGTIEEKIYELQQRKRKLIDQVIQPGESMLQSLNEEDIRELLSLK